MQFFTDINVPVYLVIFFLPFVIARVFRPTLLDVFRLTNLELGIAFSIYGFVAMLAYFPGGPLADRYAPRKLMTLALAATSIGGLVMASIPNDSGSVGLTHRASRARRRPLNCQRADGGKKFR